jgi:hypothetical protein
LEFSYPGTQLRHAGGVARCISKATLPALFLRCLTAVFRLLNTRKLFCLSAKSGNSICEHRLSASYTCIQSFAEATALEWVQGRAKSAALAQRFRALICPRIDRISHSAGRRADAVHKPSERRTRRWHRSENVAGERIPSSAVRRRRFRLGLRFPLCLCRWFRGRSWDARRSDGASYLEKKNPACHL